MCVCVVAVLVVCVCVRVGGGMLTSAEGKGKGGAVTAFAAAQQHGSHTWTRRRTEPCAQPCSLSTDSRRIGAQARATAGARRHGSSPHWGGASYQQRPSGSSGGERATWDYQFGGRRRGLSERARHTPRDALRPRPPPPFPPRGAPPRLTAAGAAPAPAFPPTGLAT